MLLNFCYAAIYWFGLAFFCILLSMCQFKNYLSDLTCGTSLFCDYDYIVVGAGTAGSIVASRLAEDSRMRVLLIEAGPDYSSLLDIPLASPLIQFSGYDWGYKTTPQECACYGLEDNSSYWPMGRVVGGTGRLNYMMYVRGHSRDYDGWSEKGNTNWGFPEHALHYFRKSENQSGIYKDDRFMKTQVTMYEGRRWSSAYGLLANNTKSNLRILTNALVVKVLLYSKYEAYGVALIRFGEILKLKARKAVILSAGTIGTPKILMRSGIGPRNHLESLKIPVVQDLPVGKNLQDHITTGMDLVLLNQSLNLNLGDIASLSSLWKYLRHGNGPWAAPGCDALGLVHTRLVNPDIDPPDIQLMALPLGISSDHGVHVKRIMGIKDEIWKRYFSPLRGQQVASLLPVLLHPKSHGEVYLRSKNPYDPPVINPKYLTDPNDVETLYEGILLVKKIIKTKAFQKLGAKLYDHLLPGCEKHSFDSPEYWECYIRHLTFTSYHPVGTCRMGPSSDPSTVVDSFLRVHNTNHLFVIDASVMPSLPSGNINAAVMMIAEKGADSVKMEYFLSCTKHSELQYFKHLLLQMCF
ncbi:glucose dehydrogenase [FAD, quinone] isoform X2 [Anabrus simplex]|uniref:glucose dehydrogenase [FAD, quinone] isoform X2 n=1 Tax=Anabrus simplex TaxID=316456 RepID=UPI0035A2FA52